MSKWSGSSGKSTSGQGREEDVASEYGYKGILFAKSQETSGRDLPLISRASRDTRWIMRFTT